MAENIKYNYMDFKFTIFSRSGKWNLDFYFNNKRQKRTTSQLATKENLIVVKKEIIPNVVEFLTGDIEVNDELKEYTIKSFADDYFTVHKNEVRDHTYKRNLNHFNKHILPYFGHRLLDTIKPMELEKWQYKLLSKYKPLTVQKFRSILFSIFDMAVLNDILIQNPLSKIKAPKVQSQFLLNNDIEDVKPFTNNEIKLLLSNTDGYMKSFILLMYATGIRPGELIALTWEDIDYNKKQISIYKTIINGKIGNPKTQSSVRKVDILPMALQALEYQYKLTSDNEYIFINTSKKHFYSHDVINLNFKNLLKLNSIEIRTLYNLRHTFASKMISSGADIVWVSKMLGHKDVSITLKVYTKFIQENEEIRFKKIEEMGTKMGTFLKDI
ncbi:MAG: site-specific integrase [Epsilonproteobacteria bacterium]|nr:MAG: site-specific integrase [Campylobacterota bacterium]